MRTIQYRRDNHGAVKAYQDQAAKNQGSVDQRQVQRHKQVYLVVSTETPPFAGKIGPYSPL